MNRKETTFCIDISYIYGGGEYIEVNKEQFNRFKKALKNKTEFIIEDKKIDTSRILKYEFDFSNDFY